MNPLLWRWADRISWGTFTAVGALIGLVLAWVDSPYRRLCQSALSGARADCAQMFYLWLLHPSQYWQMSAICGLIVALAVYGFQIQRNRPGRTL
jgi:hypothetical protein